MNLSTSSNNPIYALKEILLRMNQYEDIEDFKYPFKRIIQNLSMIELRTHILELKYSNFGITSEDILQFFQRYEEIRHHSLNELNIPKIPNHPAQVLIEENKALLTSLLKIDETLSLLPTNENNINQQTINELQERMAAIGQFYRHYNRIEKLYFPIMERYKQYILPRIMWGNNDVVRTLYKGTQRMIENLSHIDPVHVKRSFASFASKMKEIIFDEEQLFLPIALELFSKNDWQGISIESNAFGYTLIDIEPKEEFENVDSKEEAVTAEIAKQHLPFGGGYLTLNEANIILNNLPLEITFIDQHGIFKYFNNITKTADMMFIRTPISIGRHVSNCHPPKSMGKVMRLIRDLKSGRRTSETMWFKKKDQYIHITYKSVFDEDNQFIGILEYVQDIQAFFDLPRKTKRELMSIE